MGLRHVQAIAGSSNAELVAVADPGTTEESVRAYLPVGTTFHMNVTDMLASARPDVVHIVTPPESHASLAIAALSAGSHVYVEKPFAATRTQAEEILAVAVSRGLSVCAGHQYLFETPALQALEALPKIGRVELVESYFSFRKIRRNLTDIDQCKDILPHAVYPMLQQLRFGNPHQDAVVELLGVDAKSSGDLHALVRIGTRTGVLCVTLSGRPIEQYQHIVGTAGSLRVDYVTDSVVQLIGPGAGVGILLTPFRRAKQIRGSAIRLLCRILMGRRPSYPGLHVLVQRFYAGILQGAPSPTAPADILDTVDVCERLGCVLDRAEEVTESVASEQLKLAEKALPPCRIEGRVLVTGGTGFLGRAVARELRLAGFGTRVLARRVPAPSRRLAGVEYVKSDLAQQVSPAALEGVEVVIHCAAETSGGRDEHERNSIQATRNLLRAAVASGVRKFIHVSSLAVLKPGRDAGAPLNEDSAVDAGNPGRGPYVWGKAESEMEVRQFAVEHGVDLRIVRPGPLVSYSDFQPPGRLGRELGPWFIAIGSRSSAISVCDVGTAARVMRAYVEDFAAAPPVLNLVEAPAPTRQELVQRFAALRPDLRVWWVPLGVLKLLSAPAKVAQRVLLGSTAPVDLYATFSSERYDSRLAAQSIQRAKQDAIEA
jgi:nucleoside-diphosphate-sugar epimerase/predicted dehydrogenase